ncbi:C-X-C motif chemokine 11-6-like [Pimephales promelas]|uniref:C-X-C motif chemokine 11-6-like n=1 Tax=Pimephales promelas TaxID=90988 RepID=UPI001955BA85|nr:C-X-C motif chemokine 11-6-like [Pimephales promelas]KAG1937290.1 C-X-C motif chemokine 11-6-like [Pimephales promelas]
MKTAAVIVFLVYLLAPEVHGQNKTHKGRCFCADKGADVVLRKNIEKFEIMPQSPSCGKQEVIVTLKSGERKCLNQESKFTQKILRRVLEKMAQQSEMLVKLD